VFPSAYVTAVAGARKESAAAQAHEIQTSNTKNPKQMRVMLQKRAPIFCAFLFGTCHASITPRVLLIASPFRDFCIVSRTYNGNNVHFSFFCYFGLRYLYGGYGQVRARSRQASRNWRLQLSGHRSEDNHARSANLKRNTSSDKHSVHDPIITGCTGSECLA
jgi:hypothetical protein